MLDIIKLTIPCVNYFSEIECVKTQQKEGNFRAFLVYPKNPFVEW